MNHILGICGSLRRGSFNSALLQAAVRLRPEQLRAASIRDIPLYDGDLEAAGFPEAVESLKQQVAVASGLLLVSPEYNNSVPGVLKNAVDWLSRPSGDLRNVFAGKPVVVMGATPGAFGTILAQGAWLPVFRALGARYWAGGRLLVPAASGVFDADGRLTDDAVRERLEGFLDGFIAFCDG